MPPVAQLTPPPLLLSLAWSAVEVVKKCVQAPKYTLLNILPLLVKLVSVPALALFLNSVWPTNAPLTDATKFSVAGELLEIPRPLMVNVSPGEVVIVYGLVAA